MDSEVFYGVTLSEKNDISQFDVHDVDLIAPQKLVIKQIILDPAAKEGEFNVVQVETKLSDKESLKIPIAVLKAGETRVLRPNIEFPCTSVTFKLIQGNGPVHIYGLHLICEQYSEQEEYYQHGVDEDIEYEEDDELPPPQTNGKNSNKKK